MKEIKFLRCNVCGNLFAVIQDSGVQPVCCGQPMTTLLANQTDAVGEKHVPVIERSGAEVTVCVGSVGHPMLEEHSIQWIVLQQGDRVQYQRLQPGEAPRATFAADPEQPVAAYEYCNLHGLWSAEG